VAGQEVIFVFLDFVGFVFENWQGKVFCRVLKKQVGKL